MIKLVVLGFQRCGKHSVIEHLNKKGFNVKRLDIAYESIAPYSYQRKYPNYRPVFVTRDRADMLWSIYQYEYKQEISFQKFVEDKKIIEKADFNRWIRPFADRELNPLVLNLDEMVKEKGFPHLNKGKKYSEIPLTFRTLVDNILLSKKIQVL